MIEAIVVELNARCPAGVIAAKFHNTLAEMIVAVARRIEQERVVLTGGCFQNCQLTERCVQRLPMLGFERTGINGSRQTMAELPWAKSLPQHLRLRLTSPKFRKPRSHEPHLRGSNGGILQRRDADGENLHRRCPQECPA
jgi:Carbamoyltransferase, Kae1-like Domain, second subdomain